MSGIDERLILRRDLESDGYSLVEHAIDPEAIDELVLAYSQFTDNFPEPDLATMNAMIINPADLDVLDRSHDRQREWHKYRTNYPRQSKGGDKPGGYTNRSLQVRSLAEFDRAKLPNGDQLTDDPKEYYHYHPGWEQLLEAMHDDFEWGNIPPQLYDLHHRASVVYEMARRAVVRSLLTLEEERPDVVRMWGSDFDQSPLRIVFYHQGQGDVLATEHLDRGIFTMQVAESHVGLRVRSPSTEDLTVIRRDENTGAVFAGKGWGDKHPSSPIKPARHDVIKTGELYPSRRLHGSDCARWAVIFFFTDDSLPSPDKAAMHFAS